MHHDDKARKEDDKRLEERDDQERPDRESEMKPAEGSRGNTNVTGNQSGRGTATMPDPEAPNRPEHDSELPPESFGERGGGISNRPVEEEQTRQENLPPRGERRENWKDD